MLEWAKGCNVTSNEIDTIFSILDYDRTGILSVPEFQYWVEFSTESFLSNLLDFQNFVEQKYEGNYAMVFRLLTENEWLSRNEFLGRFHVLNYLQG